MQFWAWEYFYWSIWVTCWTALLTAFHTYNLGLMCLTSLPQGYTNSMIEFCWRTSFIDNLFGMGPPMCYMDKLIPENPNIHQFIYEGVQVFRRLVSLVELAGVTISGEKLITATPKAVHESESSWVTHVSNSWETYELLIQQIWIPRIPLSHGSKSSRVKPMSDPQHIIIMWSNSL